MPNRPSGKRVREVGAATMTGLMARGVGAISSRRGAGMALADQAVVSASNFLTIYLLARSMALEEFGLFVLGQTTLLLLTSLHNALLVEPQNVLGSRLDLPRYRQFLGALTRAHLALLFSVLCVSIAGAAVAWSLGLFRVASVGVLLGFTLVPWLGQEFVRRALYARSEVAAAFVNDVVCYGLQLVAVVWLVTQSGSGGPLTEQALVVLGGSSLIAALFGVFQVRRTFGPSGWRSTVAERRRIWHDVWSIGRWLLGRNAVTWLGTNGHAWVVALLLGPVALGTYRATIHLVNVINPLRQAALNYLPPRANRVFHGNGVPGLAHWVVRISAFLGVSLLPALLILVLWPDRILGFAYGQKLSGQGLGLVLAAAATAQVLAFLRFPMDVAVIAMGGARQMFFVSVIPVLLLVSVGVALISHFGILGVALSSLVIATTLLGTSYGIYRRNATRLPAEGGQMEMQQ